MKEELFSDLDKLFDVVKNSQIFHDYLSENLTFRLVDADGFQYDHIGLEQ